MDPVPREGDGFSLERRVREYSFGSASPVLLLMYIVTATLTEAEAGSPQSALPWLSVCTGGMLAERDRLAKATRTAVAAGAPSMCSITTSARCFAGTSCLDAFCATLRIPFLSRPSTSLLRCLQPDRLSYSLGLSPMIGADCISTSIASLVLSFGVSCFHPFLLSDSGRRALQPEDDAGHVHRAWSLTDIDLTFAEHESIQPCPDLAREQRCCC